MKNDAIGEITVAIRNLFKNVLGNDYLVTLYSPWDTFDGTGVNLFLYKVTENSQWKNMDWPGDRSNPAKISHPPLSLDLFYLLTPYAPKEDPNSPSAAVHKALGLIRYVFMTFLLVLISRFFLFRY